MTDDASLTALDTILDDPFHGCAFRAHLEVAAETGRWPPDIEATRLRTYELYDRALDQTHHDKNR